MSTSKILIIDEDPNFSGLLAGFLGGVGHFEVREESHSPEALNLARQWSPDLILLDVDMAEEDGSVVAFEIKNDPLLAGIPMIILSSLVTRAALGLNDGVRYLSKPVDSHALIATVGSLCVEHRPQGLALA